MRLAPGREVIPIGPVCPNGVFRLRLLDELGSPVCDFRQWANLGVRGSVGKDEVGGNRGKRAEPGYTSIIRSQTYIVKWQSPDQLLALFRCPSSFWRRCRGGPDRLPNGNCQRR